jgi:hypothetical protein
VADGTVPGLLAQTGREDFEDCFVQLAFGADAVAARPSTAAPERH